MHNYSRSDARHTPDRHVDVDVAEPISSSHFVHSPINNLSGEWEVFVGVDEENDQLASPSCCARSLGTRVRRGCMTNSACYPGKLSTSIVWLRNELIVLIQSSLTERTVASFFQVRCRFYIKLARLRMGLGR